MLQWPSKNIGGHKPWCKPWCHAMFAQNAHCTMVNTKEPSRKKWDLWEQLWSAASPSASLWTPADVIVSNSLQHLVGDKLSKNSYKHKIPNAKQQCETNWNKHLFTKWQQHMQQVKMTLNIGRTLRRYRQLESHGIPPKMGVEMLMCHC